MAMELGVTPIFASGCLAFTKEAEALVPGIGAVAVKFGVSPGSGDEMSVQEYEKKNLGAIHIHPEKVRKMIKKGAYDALEKYKADPKSFILPDIKPPYVYQVTIRPDGDKKGYKYRTVHPTSAIQVLLGNGETTYE